MVNLTKKLHIIILISCVFLLYLIWSYKGCHTVAEFNWDKGITLSLCMTNNLGKTYETQATEMSMPKKEEGTKTVQTPNEHSPVMKSVDFKMEKAMKAYANAQKVIVLSLMDSGTVDMAANLYLTSYHKFNITNYLFISSDSKSCPTLSSEYPAIHCVQYVNDTNGLTASSFGTKAFVRKTHYKTQAILEAVRLGFSVLLVDIDIVMFKNPFPYLDQCPQCDLQIQWDHNMVCSGFFYIRSTQWGRYIFIILSCSYHIFVYDIVY